MVRVQIWTPIPDRGTLRAAVVASLYSFAFGCPQETEASKLVPLD